MSTYYEIRVRGHLEADLSEWLGGMAIANLADGEALLSGVLPDQSALQGVLAQLHRLGLELLSVNRTPHRSA